MSKIYLPFFTFIAVAFLYSPVIADPVLQKPVDCEINQECWIVNYVDVNPAENEARDLTCGRRTYDAHKGTDFALRDWVQMAEGIDVKAAAEGRVVRVRDGIEDITPSEEDITAMKAEKKGCGNGVFIDHGEGWQTIYCHLKKNSIKVQADQNVAAGDVIGKVGNSGIAEFPHLHFGVFNNGETIDPFTSYPDSKGCYQPTEKSLWDKSDGSLKYYSASLYASGFKNGVPDFNVIKKDARPSIEAVGNTVDALTYWAVFFGVKKGDVISLRIYDTAGNIFAERDVIQEKNRARQFYFVGKKTTRTPLKRGIYSGEVRLERPSEDTAENSAFILQDRREITIY